MKFIFEELDVVCLNQDISTENLSKGTVGTILTRFSAPYEAYEVEFCDENGKPVSVSETVVLSPSQLEKHPSN